MISDCNTINEIMSTYTHTSMKLVYHMSILKYMKSHIKA